MLCDEFCQSKNIPPHLHQCGRIASSTFPEGEVFYRRYKIGSPDVTQSISFKRDSNSVNQAGLCQSPNDALIETSSGKKYEGQGVLQIPMNVWHQRSWTSTKGTLVSQFEHAPERCNYSHCNMTVLLNGEPHEVTASGVKMAMREALQKVSTIAVPSPNHGYLLKHKDKGITELQPPRPLTRLWFEHWAERLRKCLDG